jgi:hypothetical protein
MIKRVLYGTAAIVGLACVVAPTTVTQTVHATYGTGAPPIVFQAAGPTVASVQSMVDAFRAAIGGANNGNVAGPLAAGRREINWDGGGSTATSLVATPFDGFLVTRGGRFTTPGSGFVQAPTAGLATTFGNPTYETIFQAFSPVRLFSPIDSNVTRATFFVPGGGELPATTRAFGAVFSDVDQSGDDRRHPYFGWGKRRSFTSMLFFGVKGNLLYSADVPASQGDASLSFLGVLFDDARVAYVRIVTGNTAPGPKDTWRRDIVMMDDFVYAEPQPVEGGALLLNHDTDHDQ